ncbi:MAG: nucleoside hydrolase-like domain-containing protein [Acidobacteriota bacterium]
MTTSFARVTCLLLIASAAIAALAACRQVEAPAGPIPPSAPTAETFTAIAARVDPFVDRTRVIVLTDIANEPDDQMSMVRFLVYANEFDVEGLIAGTSTWMRNTVRPDVIQHVIDAYDQVQPTLATHAAGYPTATALRALVTTGQSGYGMAAVGTDKMSPGAEHIIQAVDRADARPLWVLAWGGSNTLAQALLRIRETRPADQVQTFVSRLRVYAISDQDDAGPWIRREFPTLAYIAIPSTPDGDQYAQATWTGISGDRFYRNADGADFTTFTDDWVNANIRSKGPLGHVYIHPCCIHEGDTPSFLGLINNGLASAMSPAYGGWGGRYVWRQYYGESRPSWTQGGDAYPGKDSSRDTVLGIDGMPHTSDQATIWRWRTAFQHDFAARMSWTMNDVAHANHNPTVVINGQAGKAPLMMDVQAGAPVTLDAAGTSDPDHNALTYSWFFYAEAGSGIPMRPVFAGPPVPIGGGGNRDEGGIPSAAAGGARQPPDRVIIRNGSTPKAIVFPRTPGIAHLILAVEDNGTPSLTAYRRVILTIK